MESFKVVFFKKSHCVKSIFIRTPYLSVFSPNAENMDQKNSEYGHFSRSELLPDADKILVNSSGRSSFSSTIEAVDLEMSYFSKFFPEKSWAALFK